MVHNSRILTFPDPSPDCNYNQTGRIWGMNIYPEVSQRNAATSVEEGKPMCEQMLVLPQFYIEAISKAGISEFKGNNYRDMLSQLLG